MALSALADNFQLDAEKFSFERDSFATLEEMQAYGYFPIGYRSYCEADGKWYDKQADGSMRWEHQDIYDKLNSLSYNLTNNCIQTDNISSFAVTTDKIADEAVTGAKIAKNAVSASHIADASLSFSKIASGSLISGYIQVASIPADRIADGTITGTQIGSNVITATKIAAKTILAYNIADGAVTEAKIADGAVTGDKIRVSSITSSHIAYQAVTADKLTADLQAKLAVQIDKFTPSAVEVKTKSDGTYIAVVNVSNTYHDYNVEITADTQIIVDYSSLDKTKHYHFDLYVTTDGTHTITFPNLLHWAAEQEYTEAGTYHIIIELVDYTLVSWVDSLLEVAAPSVVICNISSSVYEASAPADGVGYKGENIVITAPNTCTVNVCSEATVNEENGEDNTVFTISEYLSDKDVTILIRDL